MLRRDVLRSTSGFAVALAGGAAGSVAQAQTAPPRAPSGAPRASGPASGLPRWDRTLVLVELKGANDGLNTLVPYADPLYAKHRPTIHVPRERVLQLDEHVGFAAPLKPLMESWQAKDLAIVQGLGYPFPNRSHFRSIEIWDTASASSQTLSEGWISQAFAGQARPPGTAVDGIVADFNALPASGPGLRTIVMQDAENFIRQAERMKAEGMAGPANPALAHLLKVQGELHAASLGLRDRLKGAPAPAHAYAGDGPFGRQLDLATRILLAKVPVVAIKVAIGGFDTHARQVETHERLLAQLADGLATLRRNLVAAGLWQSTLVLTYSEFGRRVAQNASGGTDHGTAAPHLAMGGAVKGGLHGAQPSLADLQDGDLKHTVDFRHLFATVAQRWWGLPQDFGQRRPQLLDLVA